VISVRKEIDMDDYRVMEEQEMAKVRADLNELRKKYFKQVDKNKELTRDLRKVGGLVKLAMDGNLKEVSTALIYLTHLTLPYEQKPMYSLESFVAGDEAEDK
jgi:hypothetical protein